MMDFETGAGASDRVKERILEYAKPIGDLPKDRILRKQQELLAQREYGI